jgi:copper resistance protein D
MHKWRQFALILVASSCLMAQPATIQNSSVAETHHHHESMSNEPASTENPLKLLADKKESEFNHHLAGFFVVLGGLFILAEAALTNRWPAARYVWPATFLFSGIFLLVWSDTELWPFGTRQWLEALQNNREVLQHKTFAALLLGLAWTEYPHAGATARSMWNRLVFPILAVGGSILLLFHQHQGGMHGPDHMAVMARIQFEHLSYATMGIGIGLARLLAEMRTRGQKVFATLWPILMAGLGILLMFYQE